MFLIILEFPLMIANFIHIQIKVKLTIELYIILNCMSYKNI